jgi:potassium-transporting ATPase KdpC subunit
MLRTYLGPLRLMLCMMGIIMLVYGVGISLLAYGFWPHQSKGSLVYRHHQVIASTLMGQQFCQDKYFWPRQSLTNYQNDLVNSKMIAQKNRRYWQMDAMNLPSASQVDPDITIENAYAQIERVAKARHISEKILIHCVKAYTKSSFLGFGYARVNVLRLNLGLDEKADACYG